MAFHFIAFGVIRRSEHVYEWASRNANGRVSFHEHERSARRAAGSGQIERTRDATAEDRRADREAKAAAEVTRAARHEQFMRDWAARA